VANKTKATVRSLKYLRDSGWTACVVERWIPPRGAMKFGVRIDAFGFGDLLACRQGKRYADTRTPHALTIFEEDNQIALVQCFPLARWKDHLLLRNLKEMLAWKAAGGIVLFHGWALKPKDGVRGAKKTWQLREEQI